MISIVICTNAAFQIIKDGFNDFHEAIEFIKDMDKTDIVSIEIFKKETSK